MSERYHIEINEIKAKSAKDKTPLYIDIPLSIFWGLPVTILSSIFVVFGNLFYSIFKKPLKEDTTWNNLKWNELVRFGSFTVERSEPINLLLENKQQDWFEEDPVYALRITSIDNLLNGKLFSNFVQLFDDRLFFQELNLVKSENRYEVKSNLISVNTKNLEIKTLAHFDHYYLDTTIQKDEMILTGTDQLGGKLEIKLKIQ